MWVVWYVVFVEFGFPNLAESAAWGIFLGSGAERSACRGKTENQSRTLVSFLSVHVGRSDRPYQGDAAFADVRNFTRYTCRQSRVFLCHQPARTYGVRTTIGGIFTATSVHLPAVSLVQRRD